MTFDSSVLNIRLKLYEKIFFLKLLINKRSVSVSVINNTWCNKYLASNIWRLQQVLLNSGKLKMLQNNKRIFESVIKVKDKRPFYTMYKSKSCKQNNFK